MKLYQYCYSEYIKHYDQEWRNVQRTVWGSAGVVIGLSHYSEKIQISLLKRDLPRDYDDISLVINYPLGQAMLFLTEHVTIVCFRVCETFCQHFVIFDPFRVQTSFEFGLISQMLFIVLNETVLRLTKFLKTAFETNYQ